MTYDQLTSFDDQRVSTLVALEDCLKTLIEQLKTQAPATASYADLVRLVQLDRQLRTEQEDDQIREIKFTWVEPNFAQPAGALATPPSPPPAPAPAFHPAPPSIPLSLPAPAPVEADSNFKERTLCWSHKSS